MRLPKNILSGMAEPPEFYLCEVDKAIIGGLNVIAPSGDFKFNTYSEITFEVDRVYQDPITGENVVNPLYDKVEALRLIYIVGYGYFQIQQASIVSDGIREYKDVVIYSLEYEMTQKYLDNFIINMGTTSSIDGVQLYNIADPSKSLIHLVLEKMPGWKPGNIDISLQTLQRSFEVDHQAIYDFIMNDMADTFKFVVEFDTYNKTVNLYEEDKAGKDTNIYIAMDTIANEVQIDYSADDIKTMLYVYGDSDISIREANLGLEYIMNIDYYNTPDWLGQDLYDAYNKYCKIVESYRKQYSDLMLQWSAIYDQISELYNKIPDYSESNDDDKVTVYSKADMPLASEKNVNTRYKVVEGDATWYYICKSELIDGKTTYRWILDVDNISSFYSFPTPSVEYAGNVYKVYNRESTDGVLYYICEVIEPASAENYYTPKYGWVLAEDKYGINMLKEKEAVYLTIQEVHVSAGFADKNSDQYNRYLANYEKLSEIQDLLKEAQKELDSLNAELKVVDDRMSVITNAIKIEKNFTSEQIVKLNSFMREDQYKDDHFIVTEYTDDASALETKKELMEAAQKELAKISQPQLSFSMDMANILAIPEFEPIVNDFECGNYVAIEIRKGYVVKTQILEVNINFDDMSDFSVTFGNLSILYSQADIHSALLSQAVTAGKSVAESGSYWKKGADTANSINNRIENGLIDAATTIKSTENQAISWDSHGIHLRKYADESKLTYEDDQVWMNNEKIVFTSDNWRTARMAVGKFNDPNLGESYGIVAPSIVGTLLAGENLIIDSTKPDGTISSFRVDSTGAKLYNSTFLMEKEVTEDDGDAVNGQIIIDPKYGIVAGANIYTTASDGTIVPAFDINKQGVVNKKDGMPLCSNFFLDINDGNAYFRGTVYADGGYFSGNLHGANITGAVGTFSGTIEAGDGNIGGWIIKKGCLYSDTSKDGKKFVGLSSRYDSSDKTSDYAIWAGAVSPSDAPFWVKRDGSIYAKNGTFSGRLEAATGSFTGDVVATTFLGDISGATGTFSSQINVGNNFIVDANGNVTLNGNINMSSGNINWGDNYPSGVTEDEVNDLIDASLPAYIKSTYIDFRQVSSPYIAANDIGLYGGYFKIYDYSGNTPYGSLGYGSGMTSSGTVTDGIVISSGGNTDLGDSDYYLIVTDAGVRMQAKTTSIHVSDGTAVMEAGGNQIYVGPSGAYTKVDGVISKIGTSTGTCVFG